MPTATNPTDIERHLNQVAPEPLFPPASDRAAWEAVRGRLGAQGKALIQLAEEDARTPIPPLPATLYLDYVRTGNRNNYEAPYAKRRQMLAHMTLAECLEGQGRFLDPLLDLAWAICEESSWVLPAHQRELANPDRPHIDLGSATTGLEMAEFDLLVGAELDRALARRIRHEASERLFAPYLARHDFWWLYNLPIGRVNNWNAVCNAGVVGAAIHLESNPTRLARIIDQGLRSVSDYLDTFDPEGGSSEGPAYWAYGFGFFTILGDLIERRSDQRLRMLEGNRIRDIARFPVRTLLSPGQWVNFSDCDANAKLDPTLLAYLGQRLDLPELAALARAGVAERLNRPAELSWNHHLPWMLRSLFWTTDSETGPSYVPTRHDWYPGMAWMVARHQPDNPDGLVLAAKGGHNNEMHNQNDVGSLIVHLKGESLIADPGRGRYTRDYFGPGRYQHLACSSRGHSVPVVNDQSQLSGEAYQAQVIEHRTEPGVDLLRLEMKDAYPSEANLQTLHRTIALHRDTPQGWVELTDRVAFDEEPGRLTSVLITFGQVRSEREGELRIEGEKAALRIHFDPGVVRQRIDRQDDVDLAVGPKSVNRILFEQIKPHREATIRLRIEPA